MKRPLPIVITLFASSILTPFRWVSRRRPAASGFGGKVVSRPSRAVTMVSSVVTTTSFPFGDAVTLMLP